MDITGVEQIALDDTLVAPVNRLKIDKSNFRLSSDLKSKEATLQVVYDDLKLTPYYKAFQITADVPEIYMQEDDYMFTTIKVVSRHGDTQLYGAILPNELTNEDIRKSESFKEYYAIASGVEPPKTKERVKKKQFGSDMSKNPPTKGKRLKTSAKAAKTTKKTQPTKTSKAKGADEGTGSIPGVPDVPTNESDDEQISWKSSEEYDDDEVNVSEDDDDDNDDDIDKDDEDDDVDNQDDENPDDANQDDDNEKTNSDNDGDDFVHPRLSTHDDEARQDDVVNEEESDDESNQDSDEEVQGAIIEEKDMDEESTHEEDEANELYRDVNFNLEGRGTGMIDASLPNVQGTQVTEDTHVIITAPVNPEGQQQSSSVSFGFVSNMLSPSPDTGFGIIFTLNNEATSLVDVLVTIIVKPPFLSATTLPLPSTPLITHLQQTPVPIPATVPSSSLQDLPNFGSLFEFDHRLKTLETGFSEFNQTNQFAKAVSSILGIVDAYLANKMYEAVKTVKAINEQLEAEVMTHLSTESKTSLTIAGNLSELELKKILIDKMERNKSIYRSDEQKNLYKALVDAYESDKLILDTYGDTILFKRCRDDKDKDEEPSARSKQGSKRRWAGKEPESTSVPKEKTSKTSGKSHEGSKSQHKTVGEYAQTEEPMHTTKDLEDPAHQEFKTGRLTKLPSPDRDWNKTLPDTHGPVQPWLSSLAKKEDQRESFNELVDNPLNFSAFMMNRLKVDTLTPELLTGPTFELMKGSCKSLQYLHDLRKPLPLIPNSRGRCVIPFDHFINNDLEYLSGGVPSREYATSVKKTKAADYGHIKWIEDLHLDWITVRRDNEKLYKFKEGDFNRLRIQDIKDMLLLLVQGKLINLTIEERLGFNVSLRMFTRSVVIQRRVEDLQLGFIHQNKDKKNRLMRIDELHKFSDSTLNDVRIALNDRLKGIRMEYLPQTIWRQSDKDKAGAMIQAIDKQLKTKRIIQSLEKFVGGRLYEDKMDSMHSTHSMYHDYGAHVKGELLVDPHGFEGYLKMEVKVPDSS
ncbi:hypothetical protein Tco_1404253 [Tanacetum coccineum]